MNDTKRKAYLNKILKEAKTERYRIPGQKFKTRFNQSS